MGDIYQRARSTWPDIEVEAGAFAETLQRWSERHGKSTDALGDDGVAELYLATALCAGNASALARFEAEYLDVVGHALAPMKLGQAVVDDLKQQVRQKLLVAEAEELPLVEKYSGDGRLRGLVRVMATRLAISHTRKEKKVSPDELDLDALPPGDVEWELERLKAGYRSAFRSAFAEALGKLAPRDRNILRLHHFGGLTVEQVGEVYGVHRATATRWLTRIREELLVATKRGLASELGLPSGDLESVMRLINSRLDASVERLLDPGEE